MNNKNACCSGFYDVRSISLLRNISAFSHFMKATEISRQPTWSRKRTVFPFNAKFI